MDFIEFSTSHFPSMTPASKKILVSPTRGKQRIFRKRTEIGIRIQKTENSLVDGIRAENAGIQPQMTLKRKSQTACQFGRKAKKMVDHLRNSGERIFIRKSFIIRNLHRCHKKYFYEILLITKPFSMTHGLPPFPQATCRCDNRIAFQSLDLNWRKRHSVHL